MFFLHAVACPRNAEGGERRRMSLSPLPSTAIPCFSWVWVATWVLPWLWCSKSTLTVLACQDMTLRHVAYHWGTTEMSASLSMTSLFLQGPSYSSYSRLCFPFSTPLSLEHSLGIPVFSYCPLLCVLGCSFIWQSNPACIYSLPPMLLKICSLWGRSRHIFLDHQCDVLFNSWSFYMFLFLLIL